MPVWQGKYCSFVPPLKNCVVGKALIFFKSASSTVWTHRESLRLCMCSLNVRLNYYYIIELCIWL